MSTKRVLILNSYTLTTKPPEQQVRVRYFMKGLAEGGYRLGENLNVDIVDSNELQVIESRLTEALDNPPDLIHAVGTPNAILALKQAGDLPIVYYGAHPEQVGESDCARDNLCGVILTLPFTANYKNFRFLRKFLPQIKRVYVPFYEGTVFCPPAMRDKHRRFRSTTQGSPWIPMDSELIGYRSLAGLCDIIGLDYRELVFPDALDLSKALSAIEPEDALLMSYNDNAYCRDAARVMTDFSVESRMPLIWNNNAEATQIGALAAVAGCFKEAGRVTGQKAAQILDGIPPQQVGSQTSSKQYSSLNLQRARELGLSFGDDVLAYFDEKIQ